MRRHDACIRGTIRLRNMPEMRVKSGGIDARNCSAVGHEYMVMAKLYVLVLFTS